MNRSPLINSKSAMILMGVAFTCTSIAAGAGTPGFVSTSTASGTSVVGPEARYASETSSATSSIEQREAARREADRQQALQYLQEGRTLYEAKKYKEAYEKFEAAWKVIPKAPATKKLQQHIIDCLDTAAIAVSVEYSKVGRYDDAEQLLLHVIARTPGNKLAKKTLEQLRDPIRNNPALTPQHVRDVNEVQRLLTLAQGNFDLGKWEDAYAECDRVLKIDPYNRAARQMQERISKRQMQYYGDARRSARASMLKAVDAMWEESNVTDLPDVDLGPTGSSEPATTPGQMRIEDALNRIRIASVNFEDTAMEDALDFLRNETRKNGSQVNFIFSKPATTPAPAAAPAASSDEEEDGEEEDGEEGEEEEEEPASSGPRTVVEQAPPAVIRALRLDNITARELLERMCDQAGCKFRVEENAVEVYPAVGGNEKLIRRQWNNVSSDFFTSAGGDDEEEDDDEGYGDGGGTKKSARIDAKASLREQGLSFPKGSFAQYSRSTRTLTVYSTQDDLDIVDCALTEYGNSKQYNMVKVSTKFVEVTQENTEELSFDWIVNPFSVNNSGTTYVGGGTNAGASTTRGLTDFVTSPGSAYSNYHKNMGQWPTYTSTSGATSDQISGLGTGGLRTGTGAITGNSLKQLIAAGSAANSVAQEAAPGILSVSGIYNKGSFQAIMRGLSQKKGVDVMSAPSLVVRPTEDGLEYSSPQDEMVQNQTEDEGAAKIEVVRRFIYPTAYDAPQIPDDVRDGSAVAAGATPSDWAAEEVGVMMRFKIDPEMNDDVIRFQRFEVRVVDFEGFVNFGSPIVAPAATPENPPVGYVAPDPTQLTENRIDMPVFSRRYVNTNPCIFDGHTIAIGGMIEDQVQKVEDKVPVFGDLPLVGRLFRSEAESHTRKNLMIFVTAEKISPTGQPVRGRATSGAGDGAATNPAPGLFPDDGLARP